MIDVTPHALFRNLCLFIASVVSMWFLGPWSTFFERAGVTIDGLWANALIALIAPLALASLYFVLETLFLSPARLETDAREEADASRQTLVSLETRLRPNLTIELDGDGFLSPVDFGETNETYGGERLMASRSKNDAAALVVTNTGETTARNCTARLARVWSLNNPEDQTYRIVERLPLVWDRRIQDDVTSIDILPGEAKRLYIAAVRPNGAMVLWKEFERMPFEYHGLFREPGRYRIELAVSTDERAPVTVHVDIETRKAAAGTHRREGATLQLSSPIIVR